MLGNQLSLVSIATVSWSVARQYTSLVRKLGPYSQLDLSFPRKNELDVMND